MLIRRKEILNEDYQVINELRALAIDTIDYANSGHPGVCLDSATIFYTLFSRHLKFDRHNANWYNRDRLVLSAGHVVPLIYSIMYMLDILSLDDLKSLRKFNSITPGHPEIKTPFMECTTGPLGQGVATAVGMAITERYLNKKIDKKMVDYYTYVFLGEGDLMEGITYEALSLAGHLKLNKMIFIFDSNKVTLDGKLNNSFSENIPLRMKSMGYNVLECNGDNINDLDRCFEKAKKSSKPSFIICNTVLGKYSINENNHIVHGKPLDKEDISNIKKKLNIYDAPFNVTINSTNYLKNMVDSRMYLVLKDYTRNFDNLKEYKQNELNDIINNKITFEFNDIELDYENRNLLDINHDLLNYVSNNFKYMLGGSSDVATSTKISLDNEKDFSSDNYSGRYLNFGVREQLMGAVMNGIALSHLRAFGACFLTFSNYLINSIRMSAIMNLPVIYYFTSDSLTSAENGVCHVPIEQLTILETIPNLYVYRPYDVNELISCYKEIFKLMRPAVIVLPKDNREVSILTKSNKIEKGAYIVKKEESKKFITLVSQGEELGLTLKVSEELKNIAIDTRVVSVPCMKNFLDKPYDISSNTKTIAITYGLKEYYYPITRKVIGLSNYVFGGKKEEILEHYGLTVEKVKEEILNSIEKRNNNE